ncbi:MAG: hypothetical protein K9G46_14135 [Flavobacteriales bacterium]|nr:hypothetical protein [Flavobacteriales bacterium]
MKLKLIATIAVLSSVVSANAQISKHRKYDWGWSYKLEMPETGMKCEFPEKPTIITLAYGYMTAASFKDELFIAAKLENHSPYDLQCRTEEFTTELRKVYGLHLNNLKWNEIETVNGHLTASADSKWGWAKYHVDAIATEDVLTIFVYAHHGELSVPGHFFASSYSVNDMQPGDLHYATAAKQTKYAKSLEKDHGRSLVKLENTSVTLEWPATPAMEANRHGSTYALNQKGSHYATRVIESGPLMSYSFFNAFIAQEQQKCSATSSLEMIADETEIPVQFDRNKEVYFRKMTFKTGDKTHHRFYVAADNRIIVQELETTTEPTLAETRYLNTFEQSVRNKYDTKTLVLK